VIEARTVRNGDIHFILGESGVGKSTFALNLLGITHEAGVTLLQGTTHNPLAPELNDSWFKHLGWIPQLPQLAHGSLRDQFRLLSPTATDEDIEKVLTLCGLRTEDLPQGLETVLGGSGEGASTASGGQIRKITADLDSQSAQKVMQALRAYASSGAIVICITHDVSIVERDDSQQNFVSKVLL
jgi:ATP-binding cassette subfamily C protein CydD